MGSGSQTVTAADAHKQLERHRHGSPWPRHKAGPDAQRSGDGHGGAAFSVTVTAHDQYGNISTGYTGTVHFSSSDGQAVLPSPDYTFTAADHGVHIFTNAVTLKTVGTGSQTVTVTDAANSLSSTATIGITAAAAQSFDTHRTGQHDRRQCVQRHGHGA